MIVQSVALAEKRDMDAAVSFSNGITTIFAFLGYYLILCGIVSSIFVLIALSYLVFIGLQMCMKKTSKKGIYKDSEIQMHVRM